MFGKPVTILDVVVEAWSAEVVDCGIPQRLAFKIMVRKDLSSMGAPRAVAFDHFVELRRVSSAFRMAISEATSVARVDSQGVSLDEDIVVVWGVGEVVSAGVVIVMFGGDDIGLCIEPSR
ncbi:hypothetical protein Agabi119p4_8974 [Agaricus bisporus var. burnettii]|uniref:Uncharacterized protein n=1 Tax=Agaricus bisporus var. burnettii TaxID=192524 RepID=A0A8H7C5L7_AGABI|nr:hypothetical protein Agabi119p4_8974 [Agaricus bisporus var. burnettii]